MIRFCRLIKGNRNKYRDLRSRGRFGLRRPITVIQSKSTERARDVEIHDDRERLR